MRADWEREAIIAIEKAWSDGVIFTPPGTVRTDLIVTVIGNMLEPLIRADERDTATSVAAEMLNEMFDILRAKVEALETWHNMVWKQDVLALIDGGSE